MSSLAPTASGTRLQPADFIPGLVETVKSELQASAEKTAQYVSEHHQACLGMQKWDHSPAGANMINGSMTECSRIQQVHADKLKALCSQFREAGSFVAKTEVAVSIRTEIEGKDTQLRGIINTMNQLSQMAEADQKRERCTIL